MKKRTQAIIDSLERQGIDVAGISPRLEEKLSGLHLRFDREAVRFIGEVRSALHEIVPAGKTLTFTITAPIRRASKTARVLEDRIGGLLARRTARIDLRETINGNRICVRLVKGVSNSARAIGFVHNPDSDPEVLFDVTRSLLQRVA